MPIGILRRFENWPLLNMDLDELSDVRTASVPNMRWNPTHQCDRVSEALASRSDKRKMLLLKRARDATASHAGQAPFARLFGKEIDKFDRMTRAIARLPQRTNGRESGKNTCDSVESPAARYSVAV